MSRKTFALATTAVVLSTILAVVFSKVAYRAYLFTFDYIIGVKTSAPGTPNFEVADKVYLEYDPVAGFHVLPNLSHTRTTFENGRVVQCKPYRSNAQRQYSAPVTDDADAEQTILIVGDSMASYVWDDKTWPSLFRERVSALTGRKTRVINLAVAGIGVRQMIDILDDAMANGRYPKPDLVLVVFITDDLDRARSWNHVLEVAPYQYEVIRTYTQTYDPGDLTARLTFRLIDTRATMDWCEAARGNAPDSLGRDLIAFYQSASGENQARRAKQALPPWSLYLNPTRSFLVNRIMRHNAYAGLLEVPGGVA